MTKKAAQQILEQIPLPFGWKEVRTQFPSSSVPFGVFRSRPTSGDGVWIVFGWLLTALATSLGAPFWFDTLQKCLRLRTAGPKPARTPPQ